MEGWLLKSSGGKGDHRKTFGNTISKWDKRWFVLRGGSTMLYYYKAERDADRGQPPAGGVECRGCTIERVPGQQKDGGFFNLSTGFEIEFILHTSERVLNLRANSDDTFRLWVAAIVSAGGRAPLQQGALGQQGNIAISKSGKIVSPGGKPMLGQMGRSLSSMLDMNVDAKGEDSISEQASRPTLELPANLAEVDTLDLILGEDPSFEDFPAEEKRKSFIDMIGEGIQSIFNPPSEEGNKGSSEAAASQAASDESVAGESKSPSKPKAKRDTPATLPKLPDAKSSDKIPRLSMMAEGEEEGEEEEEEEEEGELQSAEGAEQPAKKNPKPKRDTPAKLPTLPGRTQRSEPTLEGFAEEDEDGEEDTDEEENEKVTPLATAAPSNNSARVSAESEAATRAAEQRAEEERRLAAERAAALPMAGWLMKQSGGKLAKGGSVGNALGKWDRRWFVIAGPGAPLTYFKDERDPARGKAPQGSVELQGSSLEHTGGGDGSFQVHTAARVLTLKADRHADMQNWARAMVAGGAYCEFEIGRSANTVRPSLRPSGGSNLSSESDVHVKEARVMFGDDKGSSGKPQGRASVAWAATGEAHSASMPGMDGYLSKQARGGGAKWDRRYFVVPPGKTSLRYYKTREDFTARHEASGAIDTARARLTVERSPGHYVLRVTSHDGQRSLALKADAASTLEHWVTALSSPGRAASVSELIDPASAPLTASSAAPTASWDGKPVKILLVGDAGVGKTSVLTRFSDGLFVSSTRATVGIDLKKSTIDLDGDGRPMSLQIWDTAGQEMFRSIIASYYRGANGVLLMFDLTRRGSFDSLDGWLQEVRAKAPEGTPVVIAGNKRDMASRVVERATAEEWARNHGLAYVETSAAENICINEAFVTVVALAVGRGSEVAELLTRAKITQGGLTPRGHEQRTDPSVVQLPKREPAPSAGCAC